ncbi:MAG: outer membrane beta-barrel protein [Flavobacteriaceae bacterium]|nr:outer membrane beta-barrel protein [Flavobacteriaceae bacterium]
MKKYTISFLTITLTVLMIATLGTQSAVAQEDPTFSVSGTVDAYYRSSEFAPGTSFANLNGFALGMANIVLSYEGEKSGFVADLVYGPRGADAVFGSQTTLFKGTPEETVISGQSSIVNQLYVYYNVSDNFTLTLGNFNTFLGYEVISPVGNFNYSTSYMFSNGPFSHTGIKADIALSEDVSLMLGVLNTTDETEYQPADDDYMFGAQLGLYGQYINLLTGQGATQLDFTGGIDLSDSFFVGVNATTYEDDNSEWSGLALYPQISVSDSFALGLRGETFDIKDSNTFTSLTLTGSYTSNNFTLKPEIRIDSADEAVAAWSADGTDSLSSFVLAAIYSF